MASNSLPHSLTQFHTGDAPALRNIARFPHGYTVELEGANGRGSRRRDVAPEVARAMIVAAEREGAVARVWRWGVITTWHLERRDNGGAA